VGLVLHFVVGFWGRGRVGLVVYGSCGVSPVGIISPLHRNRNSAFVQRSEAMVECMIGCLSPSLFLSTPVFLSAATSLREISLLCGSSAKSSHFTMIRLSDKGSKISWQSLSLLPWQRDTICWAWPSIIDRRIFVIPRWNSADGHPLKHTETDDPNEA
jgi:hypothetical protein